MRKPRRSFILVLAPFSAVGFIFVGIMGCNKAPEPAKAQPAPVAANQPAVNTSSATSSDGSEKKPATDVERALVVVRELGGKFEEDSNLPDKPVVAIDLQDKPLSDEQLASLSGLPQVKRLKLIGTKITDAGLAHLTGMNLTGLHLDRTAVTDAGLARLSGMVEINHLTLGGTKISDAGLDHLQGMKNLQDVLLDGTNITDAGLAKLKGFPKLGLLYVRNTAVTDAGVAELKKTLPNCQIAK